MDKEFKLFLKTQKNIMNTVKNNTEYNDKFFAKAYYQINNLITELNVFLVNYNFDNPKKEQLFFKNQMTNLYSDYWCCLELYRLYIHKPMWSEHFQQFFIDSSKKYKNYKAEYAFEYAKYCSNAYQKESDIYLKSTWITSEQADIPAFMDSAHKHLYPSYMMSLDRLITFFEQKVISTSNVPIISSDLTWNKSKADLVILAYALKLSECFGNNTVSNQRIITTLCKVFNIEISNPQKIMTDVKNRKNPEVNILSDLTANFSTYIDKDFKDFKKNKSLGD